MAGPSGSASYLILFAGRSRAMSHARAENTEETWNSSVALD
jgi:hypothetical protein